jgi:hypothetical protein
MELLDAQILLSMLGFVVAFLFGKHLQAGLSKVRGQTRLAEQPIRRDP